MSDAGSDASWPTASILQLTLLYWPRETRAAAHAMLSIRQQIRASLRADLDHAVAHTRLAWWQDETARLLRGVPSHPLARELQQALPVDSPAPLDLTGLAQAVTWELARVPQESESARLALGAADTGCLFAAGAQLLDRGTQREWARQLGARLQAAALLLARAPTTASLKVEWQQLRRLADELDPDAMPTLRPLLVWSRLAVRRLAGQDTRGPEQGEVSLRAAVAQNIVAWRAARAAALKRFSFDI